MATRADPLRNTLDHLALDPSAKEDRHYLVTMLRRLGYSEVEIRAALGDAMPEDPVESDAPVETHDLNDEVELSYTGPRVIEVEYTGAKDPSVYELIRPGEAEVGPDGEFMLVGGDDEDDGLDHDAAVTKGKEDFENMFGFDEMDDDDLDFDSWGTDVEKAFDDDDDEAPFDLQTVTAELQERLRNAGAAMLKHSEACDESYAGDYKLTAEGLEEAAEKLTDIEADTALDTLRESGIALQEASMKFEVVANGVGNDPGEHLTDAAESLRNAGSALQTADEAEDALANCSSLLSTAANQMREAAEQIDERGGDCGPGLVETADALDPEEPEEDMFAEATEDAEDSDDDMFAEVADDDEPIAFEESTSDDADTEDLFSELDSGDDDDFTPDGWDDAEPMDDDEGFHPVSGQTFDESAFESGEAELMEFKERAPLEFKERPSDPALRAGWLPLDENGNPIVQESPSWDDTWDEEGYVHDGYTLYSDEVDGEDGPVRRYFFSQDDEPDAQPSALPEGYMVESDVATGVPVLRAIDAAPDAPRHIRIMRVSAESREEAEALLKARGKEVRGAVELSVQETEEWQ